MQGEAGEPTSERRARLEAEGRGFPNLSRIPTPNAGRVTKVLPNTGRLRSRNTAPQPAP